MLTAFRRRIKKHPYSFMHKIPPANIKFYQYTPASPQAEAFHASKKHIKALFGGDRSGKTGTCAYDQLSRFRTHYSKLFWAAALTEEKLAAIWEWHKIILHPSEYEVTRWRQSNEIPETLYHRKTRSKMVYKTWASGHGSFSAESVFDIHLDEDGQRVTKSAENIWSDCISRVRDQNGFIELSATPILGKNWMWRRVVKGPPELIDFWHVSFEDNRFMTEQQKREQRLLLNEDELSRRYYGQFAILSGACFKEFRSDIHNLEEDPVISATWRRIRVIDFGYNHPFYCGWYALDDDGVLWQYDEYTRNGTLIKDHARAIYEHDMEQQTYLTDIRDNRFLEVSIADHDAQQRAELENPDLGEMVIYTIPAIKEVDSGIQKVNRWMKIDENGQTRVKISPRCPVAQSQCETYHYKEILDGRDVREVPVKEQDEAADTIRYAIEYFDRGEPDREIEGA